jgi:hypothetical protein
LKFGLGEAIERQGTGSFGERPRNRRAIRRVALLQPNLGEPGTGSEPMTNARDHLKPDDFPLEADKDKVRSQDGKSVASTDSEKLAGDIAERLNAEEQRREEDKWSA